MSKPTSDELDALLALRDAASGMTLYEDLAKPIPFFELAPDENRQQWMQEHRIAQGFALDLGCGNGRNTIFLAKHGFSVLGVDFAKSAVAWATEEVIRAGVSHIRCDSVFELSLERDSYDAVKADRPRNYSVRCTRTTVASSGTG